MLFGTCTRYGTPLTRSSIVLRRGSGAVASGSCASAGRTGRSVADSAPVATAPPFRNARLETAGLSRSSSATVCPPQIKGLMPPLVSDPQRRLRGHQSFLGIKH